MNTGSLRRRLQSVGKKERSPAMPAHRKSGLTLTDGLETAPSVGFPAS